MVYKLIYIRKEVHTLQLGVTIEAPLQELIEEYDYEKDWLERLKQLQSQGFEIHIKDKTAYAVKPGVRRKI
ncbi:hypothetical protein B9P99_02830 [Candidatus Marsarchaeota G1 archaeon OSP_B]|jgi:hypothetical protein|uniref:Uncharacterized protein n=4 Tax=Candidatus Marsarchaeota group 1 TaxID=2203770 RepID=A0A2R6AH60_9ARCH|nr:MAG: hypothetical protein B9Q01_05295 [Candidatus Marsarchaeota G1 archaeon OSP_D]PSN85714.1 MAG: hypothetical protein B9Q02_05250 [Candidatus Marsarchaeota G1 archaeon BE_D]PSN88558.1 MAG: hypothetical protein B9Q00_04940 [Candidatus Marsarchaeota G1 archaeon OSP_C]PSN93027.1 MAG: hypothetical protein B9P99_02830 [Candidatus Marsarchaeota G1 archaeon OSP_B]